jgi:hypothetical protein
MKYSTYSKSLFGFLIICFSTCLFLFQDAHAECFDTGTYTNPSGIIHCYGECFNTGQIMDNYHLVDYINVTVHEGAALGELSPPWDMEGELLNNGVMGLTSILESTQTAGGGEFTGVVDHVFGLISDVPGLAQTIKAEGYLKYGRIPFSLVGDWQIQNNGLMFYEGEYLAGPHGDTKSGGGSAIQALGESTIINTGRIVTTSEFAEGIFTVPLGTIWNTQDGSIETSGYFSDGIAAIGFPNIWEDIITGAIINDGTITTSGNDSTAVNVRWHANVLNNGTITATGDMPAGIRLFGGLFRGFFFDKVDGVTEDRIKGELGPTPSLGEILQYYEARGVEIPAEWYLLPDQLLAAGSITNQGEISAIGEHADGIVALGAQDVEIINNGEVEVSGTDAIGLGLLGHGSVSNMDDGIVLASGTNAEGISVASLYETDKITVVNRGEITVDEGETAGDGSDYVVGIGVTADSASITSDGPNASIRATGYYATGIDVWGDDVEIDNSGGNINGPESITIEGEYSAGIFVEGNRASITSGGAGIGVTGDNSAGIEVWGDEAEITHSAGNINGPESLTVEGEQSVGVFVEGDNARIKNLGAGIRVTGDNSAGIEVWGDEAIVSNQRRIRVEGEGVVGIDVYGDDSDVRNGPYAAIYTDGSGAQGVRIEGDNANLVNVGRIETRGFNSLGVLIRGDGGQASPGDYAIENEGIIGTTGEFSHGIAVIGDYQGIANSGWIRTRGREAAGIQLGSELSGRSDFADVLNEGKIETEGLDSYGILVVGDGGSLSNSSSGTISTASDGAHGMALGLSDHLIPSQGVIVNAGSIETTGFGADGVHAFVNDSEVTNLNSIRTTAPSAAGIRVIGDRFTITNGSSSPAPGVIATIATDGESAYGIVAEGRDVTVNNFGSVETSGNGASAIKVAGDEGVKIINTTGSLLTDGESSHGVSASGTVSVPLLTDPSPPESNKITAGGLITTNGDRAVGILVEGSDWSVDNEASITTGAANDMRGWEGHGISVVGYSVLVETSGDITTHGPGAHGVNLEGDSLIVINQSSIETTGPGANGIYADGVDIEINNQGTIASTNSLTGAAVLTGSGQDTMTNEGTVNGGINLGAGNDILTVRDVSQITGVANGGTDDNEVVMNVGNSGLIPALSGDILIADSDVFGGNAPNLTGENFIGFENFVKTGDGQAFFNGTFTTEDVFVERGSLLFSAGSVLDAENVEIFGPSPAAYMYFAGDTINGDIYNNGTFELSGTGTKVINGDISNEGTMRVSNTDVQINGDFMMGYGIFKTTDSTVTWTGDAMVGGSFTSDPSYNYFENLTIEDSGYIVGGLGDYFSISGDFINTSKQNTLWDTAEAYLAFEGASEYLFENRVLGAFAQDFTWSTMEVVEGKLDVYGQDLYVRDLVLGKDTELILNGTNLHYYNYYNLTGGGMITLLDGAQLSLIPAPSAILLVGTGLTCLAGFRRKLGLPAVTRRRAASVCEVAQLVDG